MFDYIHGRIISKSPTNLVLETSGIGYLINIPLSTYDSLPDKGEATVYTQLFLRDDVFNLYGFATLEERDIFKLLISVNGVGPKIALTILSSSPLNDFKNAIVNENFKALVTIKGIGKKTAERLVLELKESIKSISLPLASAKKGKEDKVVSDAVMALISLGYIKPTAEKAVNNALKTFNIEDGDLEALIRHALKNA